MTTPTIFQVFIGPLWLPVGNDHAWDYSRSQDFELAALGPVGALNAAITAAATSFTVTTSATFPPQGGLWLQPSTSRAGQGWEYIGYHTKTTIPPATTFSDLVREPAATREHDGAHNSGDYARFWAPLNANDGKLHIVEEMDPALASAAWIADLTGILAPHGLLRTHHAIYVRTSSNSSTWTPFMLGWIESFQIEDDYQQYAKWSLRITSIAGILNGQRCPTVRIGELDLAQAGRVVSSAPILAHPCKERNSGDYVAAAPDLTGASLIDGKADTLCIFERTLGAPARDYNAEEDQYGPVYVGAGNLTINPELGKGYRWLQIYKVGGDDQLWNSWICTSDHDSSAYLTINGSMDNDARIVAVENINLFMTMFPLATPTKIKAIGSGFFDNLNLDPAEGEVLGILQNSDWGRTWLGCPIAFGADPPESCSYNVPNDTHDDKRNQWCHEDDAARHGFPTPVNGQIFNMHFLYPNEQVANFICTEWDTCCYAHDVAPWVLIQLPGMGLRLAADLAIDTVLASINISDGATNSTNGLDASGCLVIGGEQIFYSAKDATSVWLTERGANGTTAAAHLAEDPIYILNNGQATDAYLLDRVTWTRPAGSNAPKNFIVRLSNMLSLPRMPQHDDQNPSSEWPLDYGWMQDVTNHAATTWTWTTTGIRATWLLVEIYSMQTGPARPRLNTVGAFLDTACWDDEEWLPIDTDIGEAFTHILTMLGIPPACIHDNIGNHDDFKLITGEKPAWAVLVDIADYTNTCIKVNLMSHIYLWGNGLWDPSYTGPGSMTDPFATYDRTTAKNITLLQERPGAVGQLKLTWVNTDGEDGGTIVYPDPADPSGIVQTLKPTIHASTPYALASLQRRYLVLKYPNSIGVELATGNPALRTGVCYGLDWTFHDGGSTSRVGCCQSIDHVLEQFTWTTALRLIGLRAANY